MTEARVRIDEMTQQARALLDADPSVLARDVLLSEHEATAALVRSAQALLAVYSAEIRRRSTPDKGPSLARELGFKNPADLISKVTGGTLAEAHSLMDAGSAISPPQPPPGAPPVAERPPQFPHIARATKSGDLSVQAASLITAGMRKVREHLTETEADKVEQRLVEKATTLRASEVRTLVANAVARADHAGLKEREARQYEERSVAWKTDHTGMVTFTARLDPVSAASVRTVIEQIVTADFRRRRSQDPEHPDQRSVGQMRADALTWLCRHAIDCKGTDSTGVRTTVIVRMDLEDLESGLGVGSVDGLDTPVTVERLRREAADARIIPAVLGGSSQILNFGRGRRLFTDAQRLCLLERDGGCARCHAPPEQCEAHHIRWWHRDDGPTDLDNGIMLCSRCHHDLHDNGWSIDIADGEVWFRPPSHLDVPAQQGGLAPITLEPEYVEAAESRLSSATLADDEDHFHAFGYPPDPGPPELPPGFQHPPTELADELADALVSYLEDTYV